MTTEPIHRATPGSAIVCKDPKAEIAWLQEALGFEVVMILTDDAGNVGHSELSFGNGYVMVASEWADNMKAPAALGNANTQTIHIQLTENIDAHCERARAAGAQIVAEPEDQFYGDRAYRLIDPEGHMWSVSQTIRVVPESEWQAASGLKVSTSL